MTLSALPMLVLLLLMGGDKKTKAPPVWPGQPKPRPRPVSHRPRPRPPSSAHLPGFISPDSPLLTAMPVGPGIPIRPARPRPVYPPARPRPTRPVDNYPIRSPGQPVPGRVPAPSPSPDYGMRPPPGPLPGDLIKEIPVDWGLPPGLTPPPEVVISPIEDSGPAIEPPPAHHDEPEPEDDDDAEKIVVVRKGEGLSQVAQRLGRPGGLADVRALRAANIPHGPHNDWESTKTGNLTIPGQPNRGLQPGDTLFVPVEWL